jgi:hypothetical protein
MPSFNPGSYNRKSVGGKRMNGCGSFLLGNTLAGLQEADGTASAYSGKGGLGMGISAPRISGLGMGSINKKLESLMIKQSKPKPKNIKFSI